MHRQVYEGNHACAVTVTPSSIDPIELVPVLCLVNRAVVTIDEAENRHELNQIDRSIIDKTHKTG